MCLRDLLEILSGMQLLNMSTSIHAIKFKFWRNKYSKKSAIYRPECFFRKILVVKLINRWPTSFVGAMQVSTSYHVRKLIVCSND